MSSNNGYPHIYSTGLFQPQLLSQTGYSLPIPVLAPPQLLTTHDHNYGSYVNSLYFPSLAYPGLFSYNFGANYGNLQLQNETTPDKEIWASKTLLDLMKRDTAAAPDSDATLLKPAEPAQKTRLVNSRGKLIRRQLVFPDATPRDSSQNMGLTSMDQVPMQNVHHGWIPPTLPTVLNSQYFDHSEDVCTSESHPTYNTTVQATQKSQSHDGSQMGDISGNCEIDSEIANIAYDVSSRMRMKFNKAASMENYDEEIVILEDFGRQPLFANSLKTSSEFKNYLINLGKESPETLKKLVDEPPTHNSFPGNELQNKPFCLTVDDLKQIDDEMDRIIKEKVGNKLDPDASIQLLHNHHNLMHQVTLVKLRRIKELQQSGENTADDLIGGEQGWKDTLASHLIWLGQMLYSHQIQIEQTPYMKQMEGESNNNNNKRRYPFRSSLSKKRKTC